MRPMLILIPLALLAGCAPTGYAPPPQQQLGVQSTIPPYPAVPPVLNEDVPLPPVSAEPLIWQPGHWDWTGMHQYVWTKGKWVRRSGHGTMWQDGYWNYQNDGWVWIPAHWV